MQRARRWTWTLNTPTEEEMTKIAAITIEEVKYMIYGEEVAPSTGRVHLQGYVEFTSLKSLNQVKTLISTRVHAEKSRGSSKQNQEYCMKEGNFVEIGSLPEGHQGSRSDLELVRRAIEDGATDQDIARDYFPTWIRYRQSLIAYRNLISPRTVTSRFAIEDFKEEWRSLELGMTTILWGESGIGKTSLAKCLLPGSLLVSHMDDLSYFNAEIHTGIIFDDMCFKHLPRTAQIHLCDSDDDRSIHIRYTTAFIPAGTRKIITTNELNGEVFDINDAAIRRRITIIEIN